MGMMATTLMIVLTFGLSQPILRVCRLVPTTSPWATSPLEAVHGADRPHAPPAGPVVLIGPGADQACRHLGLGPLGQSKIPQAAEMGFGWARLPIIPSISCLDSIQMETRWPRGMLV